MGRNSGGSGGGGGGGALSIQQMQKHIDGLAKKFGVSTIEVVENEGIRGPARLGAQKIEINTALVNDQGQFTSKYHDALPVTSREIITHEFGHHVEMELQFNEKFDKFRMGVTSADRERQGVSFEDSLVIRLDKIAKTHGDKLSDYSKKNGEEYFAEAFVAYNRGGSWRNKIHPELRDIFDGLSR